VGLKNTPEQVHGQVKAAKTKLKDLMSFPSRDILLAQVLSTSNLHICQLVIVCGDSKSVEIVRGMAELHQIHIIMY
jgi:hypothetical protein